MSVHLRTHLDLVPRSVQRAATSSHSQNLVRRVLYRTDHGLPGAYKPMCVAPRQAATWRDARRKSYNRNTKEKSVWLQ